MNYKALIVLFLGVFALLTTSCESDTEEAIVVTGISLDTDSLTIPLESTATLVATLAPAGASGTIEWTSSNPAIAAVNNGVVTALKMGEVTIVAVQGAFSASCAVEVTPKEIDPNNLPESLKGSDYYIIHLDETSSTFIEDKILEDMRPDNEDGSKNLYVWDNTLLEGTPSGLNFYEQAEGWLSFVVGSVGWSGAGYNVGEKYEGTLDLTNMHANPDDYVFHIALKSGQPTSSYLFIFSDGTSEAKVCIGSSAFVDGGATFAPYADFTRDNEWHSIEIPVSHLNSLGVFYNQAFKNTNVFAFLAGGIQGTTLDMDAMFFYKKAN